MYFLDAVGQPIITLSPVEFINGDEVQVTIEDFSLSAAERQHVGIWTLESDERPDEATARVVGEEYERRENIVRRHWVTRPLTAEEASDERDAEVARAREAKLALLSGRFDRAIGAGMVYLGKVLQIRETDQLNITTMGNEARWAKMTSASWPADFAWRMADDTFLPVATADDMIALGEAAKAEVYRLRKVKWAHADAVSVLTTPGEIDSYDIDVGWDAPVSDAT